MRCAWLNGACPHPPTRTITNWGETFKVCEEHGDLVGDYPSQAEEEARHREDALL